MTLIKKALVPIKEAGIKLFGGYDKSASKRNVGTPLLNTPNGIVSTDQGKADTLSDLFHDAFTLENINALSNLDHSLFPSMRKRTFNPTKLQDQMLSYRLYSDLALQLASPIRIKLQQYYDTGTAPQAWSDTRVPPMAKKGSKHDP